MTYAIWDIETSIYSSFKRKANPFDARNWVVTHAFKKKGDPVIERRFGSKAPPGGWFKEVLDGVRILIGQNIKFDLLHALQDEANLHAWMDWVAAGGHVWDIQLAEYLLSGMAQSEHMLSLDEIAPRYGGNVKVDEVKALWDAGVQTHEIEPALLTRYLCGGNDETGTWQLGDVENTELVALAQMRRAREAGQLQSILLNMGSLLFTVEAERNGMFVDKPLGLELAQELEAKVLQLREALGQYLPADLPFEFKWTSRYHKSALLFGGTVQYDSREYQLKDGTWTYDRPVNQDGSPRANFTDYAYAQKDEVRHVMLDGSLGPLFGQTVLSDTIARFASGKNAGEPKTKKIKVDDYSRPKARNCKRPYTFDGFTRPDRKWKTSEEGVYQTGSAVIEELGTRGIPFLKTLADLQACSKDLGTYFIVTDPETGEQSGMLALVDLMGLIHHKINHTSTVTGRFSSSDPNLQNIPKGNKSDVKTVFVSRFGPGGVICQSDFSSLEVYVQAILTRCKALIDDLKKGIDLHVMRLSIKEGKTYDETLLLCKGNKKLGIEAVKEWDYKRTGAKVFSFQRAYGAGAAKIAASTGMAVEDVEALIAAENARYPEIDAYYEDLTKQIARNRVPSGYAVPHPDIPGIMCHLGTSSYRTPDGKLYTYREQPSPEYLVKRGTYSSFSPTEIKNYVVQGEGGEWAKAAMTLAVRAFYRRRNFGHRALLVNQVHDAVYGDFHEDVKLEAAALLHACMEAASDYMEYLFDWEVPVPVPSDTTWGQSMMDEESIDGLTELASQFRLELRNEYMGGYTPSFLH